MEIRKEENILIVKYAANKETTSATADANQEKQV